MNIIITFKCQNKVHKVNFKASNNIYFQHLYYFKSKRKVEFMLLHVGLNDIFMCGFISTSINNKVKKINISL